MQKFRPIEDDLDVAVSLQNYVKTRGHLQKNFTKQIECLLKMIKVHFEITA
jgi:hypothetical protein